MRLQVKHLIRQEEYNLIPCPSCNIGNKTLVQNECQFEFIYSSNNTRSLRTVKYKLAGSKKQLKYKSEYVVNLFKDIWGAKYILNQELEDTEIYIDNNQGAEIIRRHITNLEYQENLIKQLRRNTGRNFKFYMDGSLSNRGKKIVKMGAGFIQMKGSNKDTQFNCEVRTGRHLLDQRRWQY